MCITDCVALLAPFLQWCTKPTLRQKGHASNSYRMMGSFGRFLNSDSLPDTKAPDPSL